MFTATTRIAARASGTVTTSVNSQTFPNRRTSRCYRRSSSCILASGSAAASKANSWRLTIQDDQNIL